jgi:hypothetical protein
METIKYDVETLYKQKLKSKRWLLIYPSTLIGWCEIGRFDKFSLTLLHSSNVESFLEVVIKKNPTTLGGQSHGAKFFSGGFEEDCLRSACHN